MTEAIETSGTTINSLSQDFTNLDDQPSETIVLLYIQNSHTKMQVDISPILMLQCRLREQK